MSAAQAGTRAVDGSSGISMTDQVYALLKEEIIRVDRQPGDLLGEAGLAERYGVSKTPVREALRLLARDGWIVVLPRKGYLVRPLRLGDVREIFAMRLMLEPALAAAAAAVIDGDAVTRLRARVDAQAAAGSVRDALGAAREFHVALTDMAGNSRASATLADLFDEVRRLHFLLPSVESHITSREELTAHQHLTGALAQGDGARAAELMREHLNEVSRALVRGFGGV
jgi:DNA-binding GntR family transcriptional regulator